MPIRSTSHFTWQVLRAAGRSRKAQTGRALRVSPTINSKDGTFLSELVTEGLLSVVTGEAGRPFDATYALTEKGKHAAEFGEYEYELKRPEVPAVPDAGADKTKNKAVAKPKKGRGQKA